MSQVEVQPVSSESKQSGLTFVRPLPVRGATSSPERQADALTDGQEFEFASRLFPPRYQEESGKLPSIVGLQLGHFVLEERIGRGGMGAVFRAVDRRLDRVVALKVLSPDLSSDPDAVQRFQNEARAAARLDHDNIARVHFIGEEHGLHFIAFEFVTGTNVREFISQKGRLSPDSVVNYTLQIAEALRHTSAANVVHRDVKPSNIIVSPTGRAKLVDLGLARHQPADQSQDLTVAGTALGTFDYISPEQAIDARNVDVRSDIYSLGCTMYHMLTGEPPYPKGTMFQKVINHHGPAPPSAKEKNPQIPAPLARVVQKMMASNPDERYASADALIHDLMQIAENLSLTPTYPEAVVWTTPLFKARNPYWDSSRTWMAVALVLLLLVYLVDSIQPSNSSTSQTIASNEANNSETKTLSAADDASVGNRKSDIEQEALAASTVINPDVSKSTEEAASEVGEISEGALSDQLPGSNSTGLSGITWANPSTSEETDKFWNSLKEVEVASTTLRPQPEVPATEHEDTESIPINGTMSSAESSTLPFVVTQTKSGTLQRVATLAEAVALALDNSAVEIRADGLLPVQKSSIQIANKRVILRAAENFHPVIRFDLGNELALRPLASRAVVFELGNGGALEVYDVDIDLIVDPNTTVDEWTFVQLAPGAEFEARWASFSIENPEGIPASFVLIPTSEPADISNIMPERMSGRPSSLRIRDSICRGEMDGIKQNDLHPLEILINETAIAISGTLHRLNGSTSVETSISNEQEPSTSLTLNHVTAILGKNLLNATTGDHGAIEPIMVDIRDSVISIENSQQALIAVSGHLDAEALKEKIQWMPQADFSFVQSTGPFFTIESSASFLFEPQTVSNREMVATLLQLSPGALLSRSLQEGDFQWHSVPVEAFFLNNSGENPAVKSASDGRNAGVDWARSALPLLRKIFERKESISNSSETEF